MSVSLQSKLELISKGTTPSPQDMDPRFAAAKSLVSRIMDETGSVLEELISSLPIEVSQHVALICLGWMAEADLEASKSTQLERILSLLIQSSKLNRPTLVNQSEPVLSAFLQDWQTSMAYWSSPCDLTRNGENVKAHLARLLLVFRCAPLWMCPNGKLLNNCLADIFKWAIACTLEPQPSDPQFFDILVDCMHTILQDAGPQMRSHAIHSIGAEYHQAREQPRPFPMSEHHHTRITGLFPIPINDPFNRYRVSDDGETCTSESPLMAWDLVENLDLTNRFVTEPNPVPPYNPTFINNGSIDLSSFGAVKVEPNMAMVARSNQGKPNTRKGLQSNFDFEIPFRAQPTWIRQGTTTELGKRKQAPKASNEVLNPEVLIGSKSSAQRRGSATTSKAKRKR
ncbi:hypothetical protein BT69DRAFT_616580 [Atractiella rhizophila]|nr:hypothetical protein BT69DRAFT_616580 [Atractiella rhizophila]